MRALLFLIALLLPLSAQAVEPLKQPGKEQLYQRVLTRPDATIRATPDAAAASVDQPPAFAVLYVFERQTVGGTEWLAVGAPFAGPARHSNQGPMRRRYRAVASVVGAGRSCARASSSAGASSHAVAGIERSRVGVPGRSAVCTGRSSIGRSSAGVGATS